MAKRKNRKDDKYAALKPHMNLKTRKDELTDIASYADTLSEKDKDWLLSFVEEEVICNFNHRGEKLNTEESMKKAYNRNNSRNRCIYSREAAQGTLNMIEEMDLDREGEAYNEESNKEEYVNYNNYKD